MDETIMYESMCAHYHFVTDPINVLETCSMESDDRDVFVNRRHHKHQLIGLAQYQAISPGPLVARIAELTADYLSAAIAARVAAGLRCIIEFLWTAYMYNLQLRISPTSCFCRYPLPDTDLPR
jgi:hypothetical protein